jgi:hypothetical protein
MEKIMSSGCTNIAGSTSGIIPTVEQEPLCPACGYSHSLIKARVMEVAKYIPIPRTSALSRLIRASYEEHKEMDKGASGAGNPIQRAFFALATKDFREEVSLAKDGEERVRPSPEGKDNFTRLQIANKQLNWSLEALTSAEAAGNEAAVDLQRKRIRMYANIIQTLDVQYPDFQEEVLRINREAKNALERVGT